MVEELGVAFAHALGVLDGDGGFGPQSGNGSRHGDAVIAERFYGDPAIEGGLSLNGQRFGAFLYFRPHLGEDGRKGGQPNVFSGRKCR